VNCGWFKKPLISSNAMDAINFYTLYIEARNLGGRQTQWEKFSYLGIFFML